MRVPCRIGHSSSRTCRRIVPCLSPRANDRVTIIQRSEGICICNLAKQQLPSPSVAPHYSFSPGTTRRHRLQNQVNLVTEAKDNAADPCVRVLPGPLSVIRICLSLAGRQCDQTERCYNAPSLGGVDRDIDTEFRLSFSSRRNHS